MAFTAVLSATLPGGGTDVFAVGALERHSEVQLTPEGSAMCVSLGLDSRQQVPCSSENALAPSARQTDPALWYDQAVSGAGAPPESCLGAVRFAHYKGGGGTDVVTYLCRADARDDTITATELAAFRALSETLNGVVTPTLSQYRAAADIKLLIDIYTRHSGER